MLLKQLFNSQCFMCSKTCHIPFISYLNNGISKVGWLFILAPWDTFGLRRVGDSDSFLNTVLWNCNATVP